MYVAVTRARQRLYLSCAQTRLLHGQTRYCLPSLFLEEIPEELLRQVGHTPPMYAHETPHRVAAPVAAYAEKTSVSGFRIGQSVRHAKFGEGVIVACEGYGSEARVQVNFGAHGMKWLVLQFAKLVAAQG